MVLVASSNHAGQVVTALVSSSDATLQTAQGPTTLVAAVSAASSEVTTALQNQWPVDAIVADTSTLALIKADISVLAPPTTEPDKTTYQYITSRIPVLENWYQTVAVDGSVGQSATDAQEKLRVWQTILAGIRATGPTAFNLGPFAVGCGFAFTGTKESKVELIKHDRLAAPGTEARDEIFTVECSSPLSISGGFAWSSLADNRFSIVSSTKTTTTNGQTSTVAVNRFSEDSSSSRQVPALLLHVRLWEINEYVSTHFSMGAAVDAKSGTVGTDVEYMVGGSVAF
jgi:hypothetical protein